MNPAAVTTEAVDAVFLYIFGISLAMLLGITAAIVYFVIRFNRRRQPHPLPSPHYHIPLEIAWTVLPTLIVLTMFWYGWAGYTTLTDVPDDALEVAVTGRMWSWSFEYPDGKTSDRLVVPAERPIKLDITSEDVLHSFFLPAFRVKKDAVPGMTTHAWFEAPVGTYHAFCAEYCGTGHSDMLATVEAVPHAEFEDWLARREEPAGEGETLLNQYGCIGCHSLDGSKKTGPTFQGLFGRSVTVTTDGKQRTVEADEDYLRRSILHPGADIVRGYPEIMPSFEGKVSEEELDTILDFLQELGAEEKPAQEPESEKAGAESPEPAAQKDRKREQPAPEPRQERPDGAALAQEKGCLGCHSTDGTRKVGPTFQGLYGKEVTVTRDGKSVTVTADEEYLRRSIREPGAEIVEGFPAAMPAFGDLSEAELQAIVDYLRSLK